MLVATARPVRGAAGGRTDLHSFPFPPWIEESQNDGQTTASTGMS